MRIRSVNGYEGKYAISDTGIVISLYRMTNIHGVMHRIDKPKVLKPNTDKKGYFVVNLFDGLGNCKSQKVHRLVASAFLDNPENKRCVCHKDNNPKNNNVDNLYWGTDKENQDQAWRDGLHKSEMAVVCFDLNGNEVARYKSQTEAMRKTGIPQANIYQCIKGKRRTAGGLIWRKLD